MSLDNTSLLIMARFWVDIFVAVTSPDNRLPFSHDPVSYLKKGKRPKDHFGLEFNNQSTFG